MKRDALVVSLALLFAAFVWSCQQQDSAPLSPEGFGTLEKKGGGKGGNGGGQYRVLLTNPTMKGIVTDCRSDRGYVLAQLQTGGGTLLNANGSDSNFDLLTNIPWTRQYEAGKGLSGIFNGCYGVTQYKNGAFRIWLGTQKGQSYVEFLWHFEYYIAPDVREHFTLRSERIPFPAWTGGELSGSVSGGFDIDHYLNDGTRKPKDYYKSITGGEGFTMQFDLTITPDQ